MHVHLFSKSSLKFRACDLLYFLELKYNGKRDKIIMFIIYLKHLPWPVLYHDV